jgi:hypothetical protein
MAVPRTYFVADDDVLHLIRLQAYQIRRQLPVCAQRQRLKKEQKQTALACSLDCSPDRVLQAVCGIVISRSDHELFTPDNATSKRSGFK